MSASGVRAAVASIERTLKGAPQTAQRNDGDRKTGALAEMPPSFRGRGRYLSQKKPPRYVDVRTAQFLGIRKAQFGYVASGCARKRRATALLVDSRVEDSRAEITERVRLACGRSRERAATTIAKYCRRDDQISVEGLLIIVSSR